MEIKEGYPSREELSTLASKIGSTWKFLGRALRVPEENIEMIDINNRDVAEKSIQMLLFWQNMRGNYATYQELAEGLQNDNLKRVDLVQEFCSVNLQ